MSQRNIIKQMNRYYEKRAPLHNGLMGYTNNVKMEKLLEPFITRFEKYVVNQDVLEIACGTGNWTQVLAKRAHSVLATDINASVIEIAKTKNYLNAEVNFQVVDAYALESVKGTFTFAFAADWFSHIPKSMIANFVGSLHSKLVKGAKVIFIDMMPSEALNEMFSHYDGEGNLIHKRNLPDGEEFYVVKNFPTENDLKEIFENQVEDFEFYQHLPLKRWMLTYTKK